MLATDTKTAISKPQNALELARDFAASYFLSMGREDLCRMVQSGDGDDFAEVQAAEQIFGKLTRKIAHYENALHQYAEHEFWDPSYPGGALAMHDNGEMARNVLDGKPAFFHRD